MQIWDVHFSQIKILVKVLSSVKKSSELVIVKILTFVFSACANMKADDAAKHKLQDDKLRDEKMETKAN